uniref:EF-hand domain-containing protein n=1 Tax=Plectus sambesii TaxID=2011161 RepID=A0A914XK40_9BILA
MKFLMVLFAVLGTVICAPLPEAAPEIAVSSGATVDGKGETKTDTYMDNADANKDGQLSIDELLEASGSFLPFDVIIDAFKMADKDTDSYLKGEEVGAALEEAHLLATMEIAKVTAADDTDENGKISGEEAKNATDIMTNPEHFEEDFATADADKDGELSGAEIITFIVLQQSKRLSGDNDAFLKPADNDGDNKVNLEEVTTAVKGYTPKAVIEEAFHQADANNDGFLDAAEHLLYKQLEGSLIAAAFNTSFVEVDEDMDGLLNLSDTLKLAESLQIDGIDGAFVSTYFDLASRSEATLIDQQEAVEFLTTGKTGIPQLFEEFDKDASKTINSDEASAMAVELALDAEPFKAAFAAVDKDANGELSPFELRAALVDYDQKSAATAAEASA